MLLNLSAPLPLDLAVYRGDTGCFRVTITDPDGNPLDVSTATFDADVRNDPDDACALFSFLITPVPDDSASIDLTLSSADSARLRPAGAVWDLEMSRDGQVQTLLAGAIRVSRDVSRAPATLVQ